MSGVTGGRWVQRTMARNEAPTESRKRSVTATPRAYGTAPALDPSDSAWPRDTLGPSDRQALPIRRSARTATSWLS